MGNSAAVATGLSKKHQNTRGFEPHCLRTHNVRSLLLLHMVSISPPSPHIPATCLGTALAGYAVQLPYRSQLCLSVQPLPICFTRRGNRLGDSAREIGRQDRCSWLQFCSCALLTFQVSWVWDAVTPEGLAASIAPFWPTD